MSRSGGYSSNIFIQKPCDAIICCICREVFRDVSTLPCGHSFCGQCLTRSLENTGACPTCRREVEVSDIIPNYAMRDMIGNMDVCCPSSITSSTTNVNNHDNNINSQDDNFEQEEIRESSSKRARIDTSTNSASCSTEMMVKCSWRGKLRDLNTHIKNDCEWALVQCKVKGCNHKCLRKDMGSHLSGEDGITYHMNLVTQQCTEQILRIEKKLEEKLEEKVKQVREESLRSILHTKLLHDCRSWLEHKPKALHGVRIYKIYNKDREGLIEGLLCEIPGPKRTAWEGKKLHMNIFTLYIIFATTI